VSCDIAALNLGLTGKLSLLRNFIMRLSIVGLTTLAIVLAAGHVTARAQQTPLDRTVLPIREPKYPPITELDARKATPPQRFEVKAPSGAPNVLIILLDDMGFGQAGAFGGPVHMPTLEQLANNGLRYNEFHTTALCSPTRAALLTGRNHHVVNTGSIMETAQRFRATRAYVPRQSRR
jgi:hypothetical protein